jgi:hypothetical protein
MGKTVDEQVAHGEVQGGIAKELQAFVVVHVEVRVFMDVGPVQQCVQEKAPVAKTILQSLFETFQEGVQIGGCCAQGLRLFLESLSGLRFPLTLHSGESTRRSQERPEEN